MGEKGLQCRDISITCRDADGSERTILRDIEATFAAGRIAAVGGATGAGKSTLLYLLANFIRPTKGTVVADGEPVSRWITAHRDLWRRKVGFVFQSPNLWPDLTAGENVMVPLVPRGHRLAELRRRARAALEAAAVAHLAGRRISDLSVGERQRVSLARACVTRPAFLLVDEPTAHQDPEGVAVVIENLLAARSWNATVVVTAHDPRLLESDALDDIWQLDHGRLTAPDREE